MPEDDKENVDQNNPKENSDWSKLLDLKNEVAQAYIDKIKKWWFSFSWLIIWKWDMLKDYLVTEDIFDKIADEAKWKFLFQPFIKPLLSEIINYDWKTITIWEYLEQAKKELDSATTEAELNNLKSKIGNKSDVKDPAKSSLTSEPSVVPEKPNNTVTSPQTNVVPFIPVYSSYENLKVGVDIKTEDIAYVNENSKIIVDNLKTKWNLTKVKEIKDKNWELIFKLRWQTPYINSKAASDLVWLALIFYKKSGKPLIVESGYRTIAHQAELKILNKPSWVPTADPGYSWHNLWYSLDVSEESRYNTKIGWVKWLGKIAEIFNFHPIDSEDWHFDYKEFIPLYAKKEERLPIAQNLNKNYDSERLMAA